MSKITGKEGLTFKGTAIVFDNEADFYPALADGRVKEGMAVILRYQGASATRSLSAGAPPTPSSAHADRALAARRAQGRTRHARDARSYRCYHGGWIGTG